MTQLSLDPLFDFTIYVCKYIFLIQMPFLWTSHKL
jgi:hypothetical protein